MREECRVRSVGLRGRRVVSGLVLLLASVGALLHGCRDELTTEEDRNQVPDTYLTGAPAESLTTFYKVHFHWYGNDADGWIVGYEYAISDSLPADEDTLTYHFTTRTDSIFTFHVGASQQVLGHRFYIRAIDNDGATDPVPAWRFFGAIDLNPPKPVFTLAEAYDPTDPTGQRRISLTSTHPTVPTDTVPAGWNVRFRWRGTDSDRMIDENGDTVTVGEIRQYEYWLNPYEVSPRLGGVGDTAVSYSGLSSQTYRFSLRGVDDAGFRGLDAEERTFVWNMDPETYFVASDSIDPISGDSLLSIKATSTAWVGEREFFKGDTIPLVASATGTVQFVSIRVDVWGRDPDDIQGKGVGRFQRMLGAERWIELTEGKTVVLEGKGTTQADLQVRCADGYGRPDFTPAVFPVYINQAPVLLREFSDGAGNLLAQIPQPGQIIDVDDLPLLGTPPVRKLPVRVRAQDPDATTQVRTNGQVFTYKFVIPPYWSMEEGCTETDSYCNSTVSVPPSLLEGLGSTPRPASVTVRIREHPRGDDGLQVDQSIPFFLVDH
jgi:hypothetical protein